MTAVPMANRVNPVGPVEGIRLAYLMEGKPPGGGPSCTTGMSLTDCTRQSIIKALGRGVTPDALLSQLRTMKGCQPCKHQAVLSGMAVSPATLEVKGEANVTLSLARHTQRTGDVE